MLKRVGALFAATVIAGASLVACSSEDDGIDANGVVNIEFWNSAAGGAARAVDQIVEKFNEKYAGKIHVNSIYQGGYGTAIAKLATSASTGKIPDLMQVNDTNTAYMKDTLIALTAEQLNAASKEKLDFDTILPSLRQYYSIGGKLVAVPFQASVLTLYYNPKLIKEAGLDASHPPKTRDELFQWAEQVRKKTGKAGLTFSLGAWQLENWTSSDGLEYCLPENGVGNEPVTRFQAATPIQIKTWTDFTRLYKDKTILDVNSGTNAQNAFGNSEVAMMLNSSGALGNVERRAIGFKPGAFQFPINVPGKGGVVPGGNAVWIFGKDPHSPRAQAAWTFARFLTTPEAQLINFKESGYLPTTKPGYEAALKVADPTRKVILKELSSNPANTVTAGCHTGALQAVREESGRVLDKIVHADADPAAEFKYLEDFAVKQLAIYAERAALQKKY